MSDYDRKIGLAGDPLTGHILAGYSVDEVLCVTNPLIAFDESGHTGQDLLNRAQPIFTLASVHLSDSEAEDAIKVLSPAKDRETKFSVLIRSREGRQRIVSLLQSPYAEIGKAKTYVVHKPYMVVAKIVDLLIEPLAHRDGVDLYRQGCNIALANLYYTCLPTVCGEDEFTGLLAKFVGMIRKKDEGSIMRFYDSCRRMHRCAKLPGFQRHLAVMSQSVEVIGEVLRASDVTQLDPSVTSFVDHCDAWGSCLNCEFDAVCDESKPIRQKQALLSVLMARDEPQVQVGYDYRKIVLPLRAAGISFADSAKVKQLQIADVIAGTTAYWARRLVGEHVDKRFCDQVEAHGIRSLVIGCLWPSADVTPKALGTEEIGGIDLVDYVTNLISRQEGERQHG